MDWFAILRAGIVIHLIIDDLRCWEGCDDNYSNSKNDTLLL